MSGGLSPEQVARYRRQITLGGFGATGQEKLIDAHVAVIGADAHSPDEVDCAQLYYQAHNYLRELGIEVITKII